jgi:type IV secretion system protein VirB3
MSEASEGLTADVLFVAATRPPTRWGVPYAALLFNMVFTMEFFLMIKNPLMLLLALPIHGVCMLLCARDARFFDLAALWMQTRMPALLGNLRRWKGNSYSPLVLDAPNSRGRRRFVPTAIV